MSLLMKSSKHLEGEGAPISGEVGVRQSLLGRHLDHRLMMFSEVVFMDFIESRTPIHLLFEAGKPTQAGEL
jgi:hypothetical protein